MKLIKGTHQAAHTGRVLKIMQSDKSLGFQVEGGVLLSCEMALT